MRLPRPQSQVGQQRLSLSAGQAQVLAVAGRDLKPSEQCQLQACHVVIQVRAQQAIIDRSCSSNKRRRAVSRIIHGGAQ